MITWDAAGAPATVGVGTSGQVLTSNGAGAAPTMQTPLSGWPAPDFTSSEQTITASSILDVAHGLGVIPSNYNVSMICN